MELLSAAAIRRCIVADPGKLIFGADYDQIELRVIAALANETAMIQAAKDGVSLHLLAANRLFGIDHTPDQYKLAKNINFTYAFAGGPRVMAERYEITYQQGVELIRDYEQQFPALRKFKREQQERVLHSALSTSEYRTYKLLVNQLFNFRSDTPAGRKARATVQREINRLCYGKLGWITTRFGRRLPVDAIKAYTAINYEVQATARDIMGHGLLRVFDDHELGPTLLLPIHDELIGQGPKRKALHLATRYGDVMTTEFEGVPITATGKVYGRSWGDAYKKEAA
jgi:DNA polymerase I-like protein with 3'-5' exonuclease and polymerase domains